MGRVAVAGSVAQRPGKGGHAWVFLNYLIGLRNLGHKVVFIDRLAPEMLRFGDGIPRSHEARWLEQVMTSHGFGDCYFLLEEDASSRASSRREALLDRLRNVDLLINVNGFLQDAELLAAPEVSAFVDIDPAIQQMWHALGLADIFAGHDLYFTVGENIGRPDCAVPACDLDWIPTRPPVAVGDWPVAARGRGITTVASWRGPYGPIDYGGTRYGLRVHEFRPFVELAKEAGVDLAIALDIDAEDSADTRSLSSAGWRLLDPLEVAGDPAAYREFIGGSEAELSIAKHVYVESRCGWFSDRSVCYLASGKPVIAQETGYSDNLPVGSGLISFEDREGAIDGIGQICRDWSRHSLAARQIACEYFDAGRVLTRMLDAAGL